MKKLLIVLFLAAIAIQAGTFIVSHSATFDEPLWIGSGISAIKTGSLKLEHEFQPPFEKYLFGLFVNLVSPTFNHASSALASNNHYRFGYEFLFQNNVKPEIILALARMPSLLLSLLTAVIVFLWARRWFGMAGGVAALGFYAFEPNILAHSGIASMDTGVTAFMILASYALVLYLEEAKTWQLIVCAVATGLAMTTKLSGTFLFLWFSLIMAWKWKGGRAVTRDVLVLISITTATVLLVYQIRFIGMFFELLSNMLKVVFGQTAHQNYPNFLHGDLKVGGWWNYFLTTFLIKTPLPFIIATVLSMVFVKGGKKYLLLAMVSSFFLICTFAQKQNGLRYLLPVYPLLCILIGGLTKYATQENWIKHGLTVLLVWSGIESAAIFPNYLTYFNQLVGGPSNGYKWLVDCNLDWGQDFPAINGFLEKEGRPNTIMALFGTSDRNYYFGPHQDLIADANNPDRFFSDINPLNTKREFLIVSATLYQGFGLSDPHVFDWLKSKKPYAQIANSTFVFDVTNDSESQFKIGEIYHRNGQKEFADRQLARANQIRHSGHE